MWYFHVVVGSHSTLITSVCRKSPSTGLRTLSWREKGKWLETTNQYTDDWLIPIWGKTQVFPNRFMSTFVSQKMPVEQSIRAKGRSNDFQFATGHGLSCLLHDWLHCRRMSV